MIITDRVVLDQDELFRREKQEYAKDCKLLIHNSRPDGLNTRHQYIYEDKNEELRNFVFITNKDNVIMPYPNYLGEIICHKDMPVSTSMEPMGPEFKLKL